MTLTSTVLATESSRRAMQALRDLPPFTPALNRLLATLSNENVSTTRIAAIIESDPVIAGNVLKLVNSASYGRRVTVHSVEHAVNLMGISTLRNTVFATSIDRLSSRVRTAPGWSTKRFNLHSVACGLLCDTLTQYLQLDDAEGAFTAGLFHDLGQLLVAVGMHDSHLEIQKLYDEKFGTLVECEQAVMGLSHADLSADALTAWNLPVGLQQVARFHHEPQNDPAKPGQDPVTLTQIVYCAEAYLETRGHSLLEEPEVLKDAELAAEPFLPLGIQIADAEFLDKFDVDLEVLAGMFG